MNQPRQDYDGEFIAGVWRVAKRDYWRRACWNATAEDVFQILSLYAWSKWCQLEHADDREQRIRQASWLAHSVRASVVAELNKCFRRKEIISGTLGD
jgi:hypothetical protein